MTSTSYRIILMMEMIWLTVMWKGGQRDPLDKILHVWRIEEADMVNIAKWFLTYFSLQASLQNLIEVMNLFPWKSTLRGMNIPKMLNKAEVHWSCCKPKTCFDIHIFEFFTWVLLNFLHFYCKNNFSYRLLQPNFDVARIKH